MTNVFTAEMWLCDIAHSIVCDLGGGDTPNTVPVQQNQSQSGSSTGSSNNAVQSASGPINSMQLQGALNGAENIYGQNAGFSNQLQSNGLGNIQWGAQQGVGLGQTGNQTLSNTLDGSYLSANNPYFQNMVGQLGQAIRPQIDGQFESAGRYGSGARDNAFASALTNKAGDLAFQNYGQERSDQMTALNNLPSYTAGLLQPGQAQLTAGYGPMNQYIQQLAALKPGTAGAAQTTSTNSNNTSNTGNGTTMQPYFTNSAANGIGAGMGIASILGSTGAFSKAADSSPGWLSKLWS